MRCRGSHGAEPECRLGWARCGRYRAWQLVPSGQDWEIARERIVRVGGIRQRGGLDESLGWQLVPSGRDWMVAWGERRVRVRASRQQGGLVGSLGQRGLARGLEGNRGVPGGAARAVVLLIPMGGCKGDTIEGRGGF